MNKEQQIELLKTSVAEWNDWRESNFGKSLDLQDANLKHAELNGANLVVVNLQGADLEYAQLRSASLRMVNLQGADLRQANLEDADLKFAELQGANFHHSSLQRANFLDAKLQGANLAQTNLQGANLSRHADLQDAKLYFANLQSADLSSANLQGADLSSANLEGANLSSANLEGANLKYAKMGKADLSHASNYILNATFTRSTQFSTNAKDPWSTLRRKYSGPAMLWTILALIAACVPYVAKSLYWSAFNRYQLSTGLDLSCETHNCYSIFQLVLGLDKDYIFWLVPFTLIIYNILRGALTYLVGPMREEEERSGYSPLWKGEKLWQGYRPLFWMHQVVYFLGMLAVVVFCFNAFYWLSQVVYLPR